MGSYISQQSSGFAEGELQFDFISLSLHNQMQLNNQQTDESDKAVCIENDKDLFIRSTSY